MTTAAALLEDSSLTEMEEIPDSSGLDDNTDDEDAGSNDDADLPRVLLCQKSR